MSRAERPADDDDHENRQSPERTGDSSGGDLAEWFAASTLRIALAIVGFVLLLFALGQAVGFDLLGLLADALDSELGRWLAVAFFALLLIVLALRGFDTPFDQRG